MGPVDCEAHQVAAGRPGHANGEGLQGAAEPARDAASQLAPSMASSGPPVWPAGHPTPQARVELEVSSPQAVADAVEELRAAGQEILVEAHEEPWGQTTARIMSPEHLLVGISYMPSFHEDDPQ